MTMLWTQGISACTMHEDEERKDVIDGVEKL
jgi:hypothetical protein